MKYYNECNDWSGLFSFPERINIKHGIVVPSFQFYCKIDFIALHLFKRSSIGTAEPDPLSRNINGSFVLEMTVSPVFGVIIRADFMCQLGVIETPN